MHFSILPSAQTGVDFKNTITENDSVNLFDNEYSYMGGGVAVGDFNRDGLPDIFFAGNQVSSRLYLNKGNMRFEDITRSAGVGTDTWCTGVSVVDINNDGWPDIYVCVSGLAPGSRRKNLLFINQHNLTFTEEAAAYGLADTSYSTQAVFFDYDMDGRLDMYLLNHNLSDHNPNIIKDYMVDSNSLGGDKLFHNEGIPRGMTHPVFRDVSRQAGIVEDGMGLGVVVSDFNGDGYPDIYVANDYIRNDLLWLNNKNGTFSNCIASSTHHQSFSSMGTDAADINNDGLPDIVTLDMQPETNYRKKMMYSFLTEQRHESQLKKGYQPQFVRNMLQLNNGIRTVAGKQEPFFSEIGQLSGISETDWSWSVLLADFDNDGLKDMHICNGLGRDPTNADFLEYQFQAAQQFAVAENDTAQRRTFVDKLSLLPPAILRNYLYRNNGDLTFEDVSAQWGIDQKSISNGAVYADLDNDGDLDIITNNINGEAWIMRNDMYGTTGNTGSATPDEQGTGRTDEKMSHYLTLRLAGDSLNTDGIGTVVIAYAKGLSQMLEQYPVRGYLSSVDDRLHFGSGQGKFDSIRILWPDRKIQILDHPPIDTILTVDHRNAYAALQVQTTGPDPLFTDVTEKIGADFEHTESFFYDYALQRMLPQKYSQEGPFISVGDLDGDGLQDFFIGGAFRQSGKVFLQQPDGSFKGKDLVNGMKIEEDMQSAIFDANGDGHPDLLVLSGSSEFYRHPEFYHPRLFLGDGKGNFVIDPNAFGPDILTPSKAIAVADYDGDGDMDVFIGGRVAIDSYPNAPRSYILRNDHGRFTDVTETVCPALMNPGLINAAVWTDIDNDGKPELILAGDWMSIRVFKNDGSALHEITDRLGLGDLTGFWRSLTVADVDHDGDLDIVVGNAGLNNSFHISKERPAELHVKDFDGNGILDPVFCYYIRGEDGKFELEPGISRDDWALQMPSVRKKFPSNELYARATMNDLFTPEMMENASVLTCKETRSGYFENNGKGKFIFHPFPVMAQIAPVNATICTDVNGDGIPDIVLAGNEYQSAIPYGRNDASYGLVLLGDGKGHFNPVGPSSSGFMLDGDVKDLKLISAGGHQILLAAINDAKMKAMEIKKR